MHGLQMLKQISKRHIFAGTQKAFTSQGQLHSPHACSRGAWESPGLFLYTRKYIKWSG